MKITKKQVKAIAEIVQDSFDEWAQGEFVEAVREAAEKCGVSLPEEANAEAEVFARVFAALAFFWA